MPVENWLVDKNPPIKGGGGLLSHLHLDEY